MTKKKRLVSLLLSLVMVFGLAFALPSSAYAANSHTINGKTFTYETFASQGDNCWNYASALYKYIWGSSYNSYRAESINYLRNLSASDLTLTLAHLKEYVSAAPLGSVIRLCTASTFNDSDGDPNGHSMILVGKSATGFSVCHGGYLGHAEETTWTYEAWTNELVAEGKQYIKYIKFPAGTVAYGSGTSNVSNTSSLTGVNNAEKAWNYLKAAGYNDYGCAGILGNLYCESGITPNNLQNTYERSLGYTDAQYTAAVDNGSYSYDSFINDGGGYGIAQWTHWSRKAKLYNLAKSRGTSIGDLETQLVMLTQELESYGLAYYLKNASSVLEASNIMLLKYEKPANQSVDNQNYRASVCQGYYDAYAVKNYSELDDIILSCKTVGNKISVTYTLKVKKPGNFTWSAYFYSKNSQGEDKKWDYVIDNKRMTLSSDYTETVTYTAQCGRTYRFDISVGDGEYTTVEYGYPDSVQHSYTFTETPATCGKAGSRTGICQYCNTKHTETIQPTGEHNYVWVTVTEPTYDTEGLRQHKCTVCGNIDATEPIGKLANPFTDVSKNAAYYDAVMWGNSESIVSGFTATEFRPNNTCTRAQVVTFLWRAAGSPEPTSTKNPFTDVKATYANGKANPFYKAILWGVEYGITSGYSDGTFRPNDTVTRAQFVTFLWRYEGRPTSSTALTFKDTSAIAKGYRDAVAWGVENGVIAGYGDNTFRPNATCTRWQVVLFMYRDMADK